jgi:hypothetical protein
LKHLVIVTCALVCASFYSVVAFGKSGPTLECKANYQANGPGTASQVKKLEITDDSDSQTILGAAIEDFKFNVTWDRSLTSLYMTIHEGSNKLVFSTSRIPSNDHNDSMVDITPRGKIRLYLTCDFIEFRP